MSLGDCEKPLILHVSGDFPDAINPAKTPVIRRLIRLTQDRFEHRVVSINRTRPNFTRAPQEILGAAQIDVEAEPFEYGSSLSYAAFGLGVWHKAKLMQLGAWLAEQVSSLARQPDLLIGHKLTIEGIVVQHASRLLGIPYGVCIQGNTDTKIISARRDLRSHFKELFYGASIVFPFTPWALQSVEDALGKRPGATQLLPCPTDLDKVIAPVRNGAGFVSAFHLRNHRNKNLKGLAAAVCQLSNDKRGVGLTIFGGGNEEDFAACRRYIGAAPEVIFAGPVSRAEMGARLNSATAFVLPSFQESFGLVFTEALFAGTPIIYPCGRAVEGYFDDAAFAIGVDPRSPSSIADAMAYCIENETSLKSELAAWQSSSAAERFKRNHIARTFGAGIQRTISRPTSRRLRARSPEQI